MLTLYLDLNELKIKQLDSWNFQESNYTILAEEVIFEDVEAKKKINSLNSLNSLNSSRSIIRLTGRLRANGSERLSRHNQEPHCIDSRR